MLLGGTDRPQASGALHRWGLRMSWKLLTTAPMSGQLVWEGPRCTRASSEHDMLLSRCGAVMVLLEASALPASTAVCLDLRMLLQSGAGLQHRLALLHSLL